MSDLFPIADAHNDLLLGCLHRLERGVRDPFGDDWLPGLRAGGVVLQVLPMFTEEQFVGEGALRRTLELIELAHDIADVHRSDVALVTTSAELDRALASGRIALILALEGAEPIGSSISLFETMWRLGVRMASLTWNRRTMLADGIGETDTGGRLSSLGVEAIAEMDRLGMIVDVSHLSAPGVEHVASLVRGPFVATHSSCRHLVDHPRNLTDDQIRQILGAGGFIGINTFAPFIKERGAGLDDIVDHVEHVAAQASEGWTCVALGADFMYDLVRLVDPILGRQILVNLDDIEFIDGFRGPADFVHLARALRERLPDAHARAVGSENMIRFFREHLPGGSA